MTGIEYSVTETAPERDDAEAEAGLFAHAVESGHDPHESEVHVYARDGSGALLGACGGQILWGDLYIDMMWVHPGARNRGIGSGLLGHAEAEAVRRGCFRVHLDTMTFQAPYFYPRHGYREFARLDGYPNGAERIYYVKELTGANQEAAS